MMMKSHSNPHYKISEVAERLGIGTRTVYTLISDGRLQSRLFGRARRVGEDQLQEFLRSSECHGQENTQGLRSKDSITTLSATGTGEIDRSAPARATMKLPFMP